MARADERLAAAATAAAAAAAAPAPAQAARDKASLLAEQGPFSLLVFTRARERDDDDSIKALVEAKRGEGFVRRIGPGGKVRMRGLATFPSVRVA